MKERPILFSAPMVRGILEDRKRQTRRICKQAHHSVGKDTAFAVSPARESGWIAWFGKPRADIAEFAKWAYEHGFPCPYGDVGDRLWVRETARIDYEGGGISNPWKYGISYRSDRKSVLHDGKCPKWFPSRSHRIDGNMRWASSVHMPRWASRITLEITGIRVERVQGISEEDARAEGLFEMLNAEGNGGWGAWPIPPPPMAGYTFANAFKHTWERNNGDGSWAKNSWVWVIEFKRIGSENLGTSVTREEEKPASDGPAEDNLVRTVGLELSCPSETHQLPETTLIQTAGKGQKCN